MVARKCVVFRWSVCRHCRVLLRQYHLQAPQVVHCDTSERADVQLKGVGLTPFSRTADGRAVLRSSLREFVCSEAMHALNIPTTRALSLVSSGEVVARDQFYNGNTKVWGMRRMGRWYGVVLTRGGRMGVHGHAA